MVRFSEPDKGFRQPKCSFTVEANSVKPNQFPYKLNTNVLESTNYFFQCKSDKKIQNIELYSMIGSYDGLPRTCNSISAVIGDRGELKDSIFALATVSRSTKNVPYNSLTY